MKNKLDLDKDYCTNCNSYECICYRREMYRATLLIMILLLIFFTGIFIKSLIWTFSV